MSGQESTFDFSEQDSDLNLRAEAFVPHPLYTDSGENVVQEPTQYVQPPLVMSSSWYDYVYESGYRQSFGQAQVTGEKSNLVQGMATLVVHNPAGTIHVYRGAADQIVVKALKKGNEWRFARLEDLNLVYVQEGDQITINAANQPKKAGISIPVRVDPDIQVPQHCNVQIHQNAGTAVLDGIDGLAQVQLNIGSIAAKMLCYANKSALSLTLVLSIWWAIWTHLVCIAARRILAVSH